MERSRIQQWFVDTEIVAALTRAGLPYNHAVRETLDNDAEIIGPPENGYLRVRDVRGDLISVDERIEQMKADPGFREFFPELPKIARDDEEKIRQNFDRIARGEVEIIRQLMSSAPRQALLPERANSAGFPSSARIRKSLSVHSH